MISGALARDYIRQRDGQHGTDGVDGDEVLRLYRPPHNSLSDTRTMSFLGVDWTVNDADKPFEPDIPLRSPPADQGRSYIAALPRLQPLADELAVQPTADVYHFEFLLLELTRHIQAEFSGELTPDDVIDLADGQGERWLRPITAEHRHLLDYGQLLANKRQTWLTVLFYALFVFSLTAIVIQLLYENRRIIAIQRLLGVRSWQILSQMACNLALLAGMAWAIARPIGRLSYRVHGGWQAYLVLMLSVILIPLLAAGLVLRRQSL